MLVSFLSCDKMLEIPTYEDERFTVSPASEVSVWDCSALLLWLGGSAVNHGERYCSPDCGQEAGGGEQRDQDSTVSCKAVPRA